MRNRYSTAIVLAILVFLQGCGGKKSVPPDQSDLTGRVAFLTQSAHAIYLVNSDGSEARNLTQSLSVDAFRPPSWSPDGSSIVFAAGKRDKTFGWSLESQIYSIKVDGSNPRQLTTTNYNVDPSYSPDGSMITFTSVASMEDSSSVDSESSPLISYVYAMNNDGSNPHRLTDEGKEFMPSWSPDGSLIAYYSGIDFSGQVGLFVMAADGSNKRAIFGGQIEPLSGSPSWSPDGKMIAFSSEGNIYSATIDEGRSYQLTFVGDPVLEESYRYPRWSPVGRELAFFGTSGAIRLSTADGKSQRILTAVGIDESDYSPFSWSSSGEGMAFVGSGLDAIDFVDRKGNVSTLATGVEVCCPVWSP